MERKNKLFISMVIAIALLFGPFRLICYGEELVDSSLFFTESPNLDSDPRWYGQFRGVAKSDRIRITLYDDHLNLKETGLASEYFQNATFGYYIELYDLNYNNKLDNSDSIIVYSREEVQPDWGVVLIYEPTGDTLSSITLSGERFSLIKEKEEDYSLAIIFLIIELIICALIVIFVFSYKPRK